MGSNRAIIWLNAKECDALMAAISHLAHNGEEPDDKERATLRRLDTAVRRARRTIPRGDE
jgi:hypothetical protein